MKFLRTVLPNVTIALNIAMMVVIYLDRRNPMMGFLEDTPVHVLVITTAVVSLISAVTLFASYRKNKKEQNIPENNLD